MARNHGRILTRIWNDPDFRARTPDAQRLYLFLISQPNLNHAGLLPLTLRRWSNTAAGLTVDDVRKALDELAATRFVVIDEDAEELLIRTLVRNDGVWKMPKVMLAMEGCALEITSPALQVALLAELARIDLGELSDEPSRSGESARAVVSGVIERLRKAFGNPPRNPSPNPSGTVSGRVSGTPSDAPSSDDQRDDSTVDADGDERAGPGVPGRVSDTPGEPFAKGIGNGIGNPHACARAHSPAPTPTYKHTPPPAEESSNDETTAEPPTLIALPSSQKKPEPGSDQDPAFVAFWNAYPRKVGKPSARNAWRKAVKNGADPQAVIAAATRYAEDPARRRSDIKYTAHPATWLNDERYADASPDPEENVWRWDDVQEYTPQEFNDGW